MIEVLVGLPASAKSTYAKEKVANDPTWVRVNKDDIRTALNKPWSKEMEKEVIYIETELIVAALVAGKNVIIDSTNLNPFHLNDRFRPLAKQHNVELIVNKSFLKVSVEVCISRDKARKESVGEKVIRDMYDRYYTKWMRDDTYWLENIENRSDLEQVYLCDLDGTLAYATDRSYYEEEKCITDKVNTPLLNILLSLEDKAFKIVFVSGRKEIARINTEKWLALQGIIVQELYMRKNQDDRSDDIVKEEIYRERIEPFYNVVGVFDDRPKVVRLWRKLGLFVFNCYQGDEEF